VKNGKLIVSLVVLAALAGLGAWAYYHVAFSFSSFRSQLELADWRKIAIGLGCIYLGYVIRGIRWALLIRPNKRVPLFSLVGTQVIGFSSVALVGRVADLARPYLVARKTGLPLSTQVAVYIVERLFDAGSMALIFSSVILLAPAGSLPHPEIFKKYGYWGLAGTVAGALFLVIVRLSGGAVATFFEKTFGVLSKGLGAAVGEKIRSFRTGLDTLRTPTDLAVALGLSLSMWLLITLAYLQTAQAFVASPQLASMTLAKGMVLMIVSGAASIVQLPILGWFTQIGLVATALSSFFAVPAEPATACAAMLLVVTFLGIIPVGLIWAQFEHVSLRKVATESERAQGVVETEEKSAAAVEPSGA
jgi:glycosyltransferase 2 family protein